MFSMLRPPAASDMSTVRFKSRCSTTRRAIVARAVSRAVLTEAETRVTWWLLANQALPVCQH